MEMLGCRPLPHTLHLDLSYNPKMTLGVSVCHRQRVFVDPIGLGKSTEVCFFLWILSTANEGGQKNDTEFIVVGVGTGDTREAVQVSMLTTKLAIFFAVVGDEELVHSDL